jgi:hypothetical protein
LDKAEVTTSGLRRVVGELSVGERLSRGRGLGSLGAEEVEASCASLKGLSVVIHVLFVLRLLDIAL